MGAAAVVVFPERQRPAATVAFGNLLDLARLHRATAEAEVEVEVCEACQTINAPHAYFCKGCDGKLPAYFAAVDAGTLAAVPAEASDPEERRSRFAVFALVALWGTVTVVALLQAQGPRPSPVAPQALAVAPAAAERTAARAEPAPVERDRAEVVHRPVALAEETPRQARVPAAAAVPRAEAAASRPLRRPSPPAPVRVARSGAMAGNPVARCEGLNFFARAVCMNNQCARPDARRSPQCAETVRQARLGEARRNPKLAG
jgi:hypothetical protein